MCILKDGSVGNWRASVEHDPASVSKMSPRHRQTPVHHGGRGRTKARQQQLGNQNLTARNRAPSPTWKSAFIGFESLPHRHNINNINNLRHLIGKARFPASRPGK